MVAPSGRSRTEFTRAAVLRTVPFSEADLVVTLLTATRGRIGVLARGARRSKKRFGGGTLSPGAIIEAEVGRGRGELGRLAQARVIRAFPGVLTQLDRLMTISVALELVREATADEEPDTRLLATLERFFELVEVSAFPRWTLTAFAVRFLTLVGLAPNLETCGRCGVDAPSQRPAYFDSVLGSVVCRSCGGGPFLLDTELKAFFMQMRDVTWDHVAAFGPEATEAQRRTAIRVVRSFALAHLGGAMSAWEVLDQVEAGVEKTNDETG